MSRIAIACIATGVALAACASRTQAETLYVPNGSFETPTTFYVSVNVDSWQKVPKPDWYDESGGFLWDYNVGLFKNTATNSADHIDNCDGNQGIWLFVVPEVALFQDYDSIDWRSPVPTHAFNATFEPGKSYQLTVGVIGAGGGMQQGATLELSLYYRDANSNQVPVAAISITNTPALFSNTTHLVDCQVSVPAVKASDAWAGRHIGIQMLSTVSTNLQGGYWDLDNVRLSSTLEPVLRNPTWTNNQLQFTLQSEAGLRLEILSSTNPALPLSAWDSLGFLTNSTGTLFFSAAAATHSAQRFYAARRLSR
jgi:hypothetical protein